MKSGMLAAEAIYPALTMHGEAGTVAAAGEELLLAPEGRVGLEVKEYESGTLHTCTSALQLTAFYDIDAMTTCTYIYGYIPDVQLFTVLRCFYCLLASSQRCMAPGWWTS